MIKKIFRDIYYFFPVQLLLEQFRRHHTILFIWLILWLYITGALGYKYGIYTLFLTPEYLGKVNMLGYLILGFTLGIFIMAFHITTYIISGYQFPFIATLSRPFYRFTLNNSIIPAGFLLMYLIRSVQFQITYQLFSAGRILLNIAGFLGGILVIYGITFGYFLSMNAGFRRLLSLSEGKLGKWRLTVPLKRVLHQDRQWKRENLPPHNMGATRVGLYLEAPFLIKRAPFRISQPPRETIKILHRNHTFAAVFSLGLIAGLLVVGTFIEHPAFSIPAAASILLIVTMSLLLYALFYTFFKEYAIWFFIVAFLVLGLFVNTGKISRIGQAYGLNYTSPKGSLNLDPPPPDVVQEDSVHMIDILNRWQGKFNPSKQKPYAVIINTSGGGLKAALWTYYVLSIADSLTQHQLMDHTLLITGASGGMIGAAFFRQIYLEYQKKHRSPPMDSLYVRLSADMLNTITLHLALKDWFINFSKFSYGNTEYRKDRGWAFEEELNENTGNILDHPLYYYRKPETEARIPMMFITPTILHNGRQLILSPLGISFMEAGNTEKDLRSFVSFNRIYHTLSGDSLRFTSALRMNASYPVISPVVTLPGEPPLQVTDAGFRDNFGIFSSLAFITYFRKWINQNTCGLVIIHIGNVHDHPYHKPSASDFLRPFQSLDHTFFSVQKMNGMLMQEITSNEFDVPITLIPFNLDERKKRISLSWHLTQQEKQRILSSIHLSGNQEALNRLTVLFQDPHRKPQEKGVTEQE